MKKSSGCPDFFVVFCVFFVLNELITVYEIKNINPFLQTLTVCICC